MKYTPTKRASALALLLAAAASPVHAILNCKIQLDGDSFDLSSLGDTVHSIEQTFNTPPSQLSLEEDKEKKITTQIIPVAGDLDGKQSGANLERLRGDAGDGVRVHFKGGSWGDYGAIDAYINFLCVQDEKAESLVFNDWNLHTLNLTWSSRKACAQNSGSNPDNGGGGDNNDNNKDGNNDKNESSGWGFFTWIFVLGLIGFVVYIVASVWVSYNRYGQVDLDSLPFVDFLRDIPFVLRDLVTRVVGLFQGSSSSSSSSSRAGYAAV